MPPEQAASIYRSGVQWFYWLAGLSVVNSILAFTGAGIQLIFGLGITQLFDAMMVDQGGSAGFKLVGVGLNMIVAGLFVGCGFATLKLGWRWTLWAGIALYALDAVVCGLGEYWLGLAVHAYILFRLGHAAMVAKDVPAGY